MCLFSYVFYITCNYLFSFTFMSTWEQIYFPLSSLCPHYTCFSLCNCVFLVRRAAGQGDACPHFPSLAYWVLEPKIQLTVCKCCLKHHWGRKIYVCQLFAGCFHFVLWLVLLNYFKMKELWRKQLFLSLRGHCRIINWPNFNIVCLNWEAWGEGEGRGTASW